MARVRSRPRLGGGWLSLGTVFALCLSALVSAQAAERGEGKTATIFAAASLGPALDQVISAFASSAAAQDLDLEIRPVYAASSTLARQILAGAPADLYLSAHPRWTQELEQAGVIQADRQVQLLGNRLALIAPADSTLALSVDTSSGWAAALAEDRLALGDPQHVPAGLYAAEALRRLGLWDLVASRLAQAPDVRAALALVSRGEAALGIVYRSDLVGLDSVRLLQLLPAEAHSPIVYDLAVIRQPGADRTAATAFFDYLQGPEATELFEAHGFNSRLRLRDS